SIKSWALRYKALPRRQSTSSDHGLCAWLWPRFATMAAIKGATMNKKKTNGRLRDELAAARQRIAELEAALARHGGPSADPPAPSPLTLPTAFQAAFANSLPGILYLFDAQARLLWWNEEFERATGYSATELARASAARFVLAEALPRVLERFRAALDAGS